MIHQVEKGDNLYRIGIKYGTSAEEIRILNGMKNYDIYPGQIVRIPDSSKTTTKETNGEPGSSALKPSDLCITQDPLPLNILDALIEFHYNPIKKLMRESGLTVWASLKSGFRPLEYEIKTGRGAGSQHTFSEIHKYGIGAVDWTTEKQYLDLLQHELIGRTNYRRLARYNNFIHGDFKDIDCTRRLYVSDELSNWTFIKTI